MEEKSKKNILNTIFTIIVIILVIFGIMSIVKMILWKDGNQENNSIKELSTQLKEIYSDLTIYSSADNEVLFIELKNWSNSYAEELSEIIDVVKTKLDEDEFKSYKKLSTIAYLESSGKKNALLVRQTYNIPDFTKDSNQEYIIFEEYQKLYNTLKKTTDSYTDLFNGIY